MLTYHRLESATQTRRDAQLQQASGELWGKAASTSPFPMVKAYRGGLPPNTRGIEFTSMIPSTPGTGSPRDAFWYPCLPGVHPCTPQVKVISRNGIDFAIIAITVTKNTQVP
jgi:hypothetical protein